MLLVSGIYAKKDFDEFKYTERPWSSTLLFLWIFDYYSIIIIIIIPDISP